MKSIKIQLKPDSTVILPFAHFDVLQGIVYKLMSDDAKLSETIHNKLPGAKKQFKFFCFTDFNGRYTIEGKSLVFKDTLRWEIRSADDRIIDAIKGALEKSKRISVNDRMCTVVGYRVSQSYFCTDTMVFTMNTPLLYYLTSADGHTQYFSPENEQFFRGIEANIKRKYEAFYDAPLNEEIKFSPACVKDKDKCVTRYKNTMITGYYGKYRLECPARIMDFIYHTGLGAKNSIGFGTVEEEDYE